MERNGTSGGPTSTLLGLSMQLDFTPVIHNQQAIKLSFFSCFSAVAAASFGVAEVDATHMTVPRASIAGELAFGLETRAPRF